MGTVWPESLELSQDSVVVFFAPRGTTAGPHRTVASVDTCGIGDLSRHPYERHNFWPTT